MLSSNIILKGNLVTLRQAKQEDDKILSSILSDPVTMKNLGVLRPQPDQPQWTEEDYRKRRERFQGMQERGEGVMLHVVENVSEKVIGMCGFREIDNKNKCAELGVAIHHSYWGKQYGLEAQELILLFGFETLCLHRIFAHTLSTNTAMRGFFTKYEFDFEGTLKEAVLIDGVYNDWCMYALLENKWKTAKSKLWERLGKK